MNDERTKNIREVLDEICALVGYEHKADESGSVNVSINTYELKKALFAAHNAVALGKNTAASEDYFQHFKMKC